MLDAYNLLTKISKFKAEVTVLNINKSKSKDFKTLNNVQIDATASLLSKLNSQIHWAQLTP